MPLTPCRVIKTHVESGRAFASLSQLARATGATLDRTRYAKSVAANGLTVGNGARRGAATLEARVIEQLHDLVIALPR